MICSCQKQDATVEAQLAQRKTELDARETALDEREKALERKERAVAEREKALANGRVIQSQRQAPDAAQAEAERQRRIQQLPAELRALIPDRSQANAEKAEQNPVAQQPRAVRTQPSLEDAQRKKMFGAMASPQPQVSDGDATSPSPSPQ